MSLKGIEIMHMIKKDRMIH